MGKPWRVAMLGHLRATHADRVVTRFRSQKAAALLAYLALHGHRSHPRTELVERFWPESTLDAGRVNLRAELSSLRRQLEPPGHPQGGGIAAGAVLVADRASVRLNPEAYCTDVGEFEAALLAAARTRSGTERLRYLADAVALYQGELLPGFLDEWILPERVRLADACSHALLQLMALLEQAGDLQQAIRYARRALEVDPLDEPAHQELIRLLALAGRPEAAIHHYEELERFLVREVDAAPAEATRSLARQIRDRPPRVRPGVSVPVGPGPEIVPDHSRSSLDTHRPSAPTGTVTFLLAEVADPPASEGSLSLLASTLATRGGHAVPAGPHLVAAAFQSAADALAAAQAGQAALPGCRMALHTSEVDTRRGRYDGPALAQATRLLLAAHPGQLLLSEPATILVRDALPAGAHLIELGVYRLEERAAPGRIHQVTFAEADRQKFPAPNALPGHAGNLPPQFTRCFGREAEIARLGALLAPPAPLKAQEAKSGPFPRLVSLTGPAGSGKTRLAIEAAWRAHPDWNGAVWFVPLADLGDSGQIPDKLLGGLRLPRSPHLEPLDQAVAYLSRQPSLLLLDNMEHLLPSGALVVRELLERVPALTCLVTSRRPLNLEGEQEFPVAPLPVPGVQADADRPNLAFAGPERLNARPEGTRPERLIQCPSVRLFIDRAQAVLPDFQLTRGNAAMVAALCARLEGLPLSIVLAAARVGVLTPAQILSRLDHRLNLLNSRQADASKRHRSLRAALDWSYQLLTPELRRLFSQLCVFRGGFTLAAAEAVCEEPEALACLEHLRECSLVLVENSSERHSVLDVGCSASRMMVPNTEHRAPNAGPRFRLLETLREYAAEQLSPAERTGLDRRHMVYYLALAEPSGQRCWAAPAGRMLQIEMEHDNMRAALAWAVDTGEAEPGLRLGGTLLDFWYTRGHLTEGRGWLSRLLALDGAASRTAARAGALNAVATLARFQGDFAEAQSLCEEGLPISREVNEKWLVAFFLGNLGLLALFHGGDVRAAQSDFEESLATSREINDPWGVATTLNNLGLVALHRCDYMAARAYCTEALEMLRELGDQVDIAISLSFLGSAAMNLGEMEEARSYGEQALAISRALGDQRGIGNALRQLAEVAACQGNFEAARRFGEESLSFHQEVGNRWGAARSLTGLGWAALHEGHTAAARSRFEEALRLLEPMGDRQGMAAWLDGMAALSLAQNRPERAARGFGAAEALRQAIGAPLPPATRPPFERQVAAARLALGVAAFAAAWAAGQALPWEQAVAEARQEACPSSG